MRTYGRQFGPGIPEDKENCVESVSDGMAFPSFYQCSRKRGHGPTKEFCFQHSPEALAKREAVKQKRYDAASEKAMAPYKLRAMEEGVKILGEIINTGPFVDDDGRCSFCAVTANDSDELERIGVHTKTCEWRRGKEFLARIKKL